MQSVVATSSAEAELYANNKCAAECIGVKSIAADFGDNRDVVIYTDSLAALGIIKRTGVGRLKHLDVQYLWCQELLQKRRARFMKVHTTLNPVDMMTKPTDGDTIIRNTACLGLQFRNGRADEAPKLCI